MSAKPSPAAVKAAQDCMLHPTNSPYKSGSCVDAFASIIQAAIDQDTEALRKDKAILDAWENALADRDPRRWHTMVKNAAALGFRTAALPADPHSG